MAAAAANNNNNRVLLGRGGFGEVWADTDHRGNRVARKYFNRLAELRKESKMSEYCYDAARKIINKANTPDDVREAVGNRLRFVVTCIRHNDEEYFIDYPLAKKDLHAMIGTGCPEFGSTKDLHYAIAGAMLGLQFLHDDARVVHVDLKPANLLLFEGGHIKIGDLGLAVRIPRSGDTLPQAKIGSIDYVAPEVSV